MNTMKMQTFAQAVTRYAMRILIWLAFLLPALAVLDFFIGWRTMFLYAESLFILGGGLTAIGALSTMGHWTQGRNFKYQYASSVSDANLAERAQIEKRDDEATYAFSTLAIASGSILILLSILIHQFL
jgi:hypothetical protein